MNNVLFPRVNIFESSDNMYTMDYIVALKKLNNMYQRRPSAKVYVPRLKTTTSDNKLNEWIS